MSSILSPLAQGYGVCRKDGLILIPEGSGAIPSYSTKVKNAGGALYGHFVPVPKTYLTRRGDIILFTENACDIVYLEQMYTRKIRELYEQQIKTVDDLNKSILFYGSKTPGEYSLNFIRGKFYSDRDIAVQPGHLPAHYLNSLTRHVKLSSVLRPRAPAGSGVCTTPFVVDPAVTNIKLPIPGEEEMTEMTESTDEEEAEYETSGFVKRRALSPVERHRLPPIQVSQKFASRPKPDAASPVLNKVGLSSDVLGLHGTNALPIKKHGSEIPALPKVVTGPSAKARSRGEWSKLGSLINSLGVLRRISDHDKPKDKEALTIIEDQKPIYKSAMAMDIHFLKENRRHINGSHAGVYLTQLHRDGAWTNEDVPVYVTPDGKVFISSVIVNQPVCSSDRIKFAQQDDADDVHNKPEEGSLTFSDGQLTGWVKFPGQKTVKIRGKRWDPRQTGHYVVEQKAVPETGEEGGESDKDEWQLVPLHLSVMLGGKVTMNDEPVFNPLFEENNIKLRLNDKELYDDLRYIVASFDPTCTFFKGRLTSDSDVEIDVLPHNTLDSSHHEIEIRARKWNPALVGHYYCLKKSDEGTWEPFDMPLEILSNGTMALKNINLGVPQYNGNEVNMWDVSHDSLPDSISLTFLDDKYIGYITAPNGEAEEIRGIKWDSSMVGKYSTQEKEGDSWINKSEKINIAPNGSVEYDGRSLAKGFIVHNKIFVVSDGGVEGFFNNTGPVSDANLSGQSFLMQRDSPVRHIPPISSLSSVPTQKEQLSESPRTIQEAEIVFSSNRFYGHVMCEEEEEFVEIRGYKWDEAIIGEYFTEFMKSDGTWGGGPIITITPDGGVLVNKVPMSDTLLKDNIVSISDISIPNSQQIQKCLVAIQDKLLSGWIQATTDSPKVQIRGSLWKEGPGAHGSYICAEKVGDKWMSSNKAVIVTPSNKVRISDLNLEGEMDGLSARLKPALGASPDCVDNDTIAKLRFEGDSFSGTITHDDIDTEIAGFKFDTTPGVFLLESRPLNTDEDWTGLNLQLVVSDNSRISVAGTAVTDLRVEKEFLHFDSDTLLNHLAVQFKDKAVVGQGVQQDKDGATLEVEVRGSTWCPKIAGTYETEIFTDSGWKPAKRMQITAQGEVLYGSEQVDNIRLDTDTMSFGLVADQLQDATLAFDRDGFTGNVVTPRDNKSRVFRGKRVGTRPVSAHNGTELSLGNEEEDKFEDLNGQIGSTVKKLSSSPVPVPAGAGPGVTSDYGSASDVITQQHSGSRTDILSSLEEDVSTRSKSSGRGRDERRDSGTGDSSEGTGPSKLTNQKRSSDKDPASGLAAAGEDHVDIGDISLDLDDSPDTGVSFESWPPKSKDEGKILDLDDDSNGDDEFAGRIKLDFLPQGLASHGKTETKNFTKDEVSIPDEKLAAPKVKASMAKVEAPIAKAFDDFNNTYNAEAFNKISNAQASGGKISDAKTLDGKISYAEAPINTQASIIAETSIVEAPEPWARSDLLRGSPKLPGIGTKGDTPKLPPVSPDSPISSNTSRSVPVVLEKATRTPLPVIPPKTLESPALTKSVKLPGIDVRTKGAAAQITDDAGVLKNYIEPKKRGKKGKRMKKGKPKREKKEEKKEEEEEEEDDEEDDEVVVLSSTSPLDMEERARLGIEQAQARRTPTVRTPIHMARIDRDSSRDTSPVSSGSGYATPSEYTNGQSPLPREFQGALMAAKKMRETSDQQLDGKIPSDIREHPVAEEVAVKFGMEMKVRDEGSSKLSVKERRELARQKKKDDAERKRRERDEDKRRQKEEEERKLAEEDAMRERRVEREAELAAERQRELERRKVEETRRRQAKLEERDKKKREEDRMVDAKRRLEEELKRRRQAEVDRLAEIERQKLLALEREKEEQDKRSAEAEVIRAQMEEEMAREMVAYEKKVREEQERLRIEDALKAEAERRLLDAEERKRIIALARHLWNKGVRIEGENLTQELEISSIFYSYFNYLQAEEPFNPNVDVAYKEKVLNLEGFLKNKEFDKV